MYRSKVNDVPQGIIIHVNSSVCPALV